VNLGVAATNMVPIPPLDGYRIVSEGVEALRGGQPANPKLERAITAGGLVLIFLTGLYLLLNDITKLVG
jgi:membrane-associated protease RseP (regulator of RpoE activity)